ncbi:MAG: GAF domain-containing protein [Proteobacteria bacterium]|nr:MAG: GAF domain-containing protein [Pseudomonadota bacterium]
MEASTAYFERVTRALQEAAEASRVETDPERALSRITAIAQQALGDPDAGRRTGEGDFRCSGVFLLAGSRDHLILHAEHGYPPEQHRARISITDSNPGQVVRTGQPKIVPNTDNDPNFRQILSTVRVGSSVYLPVIWQRQVLGMFNVAAEARYTLSEIDLRVGQLFANLSAATWMALDGPRFLADVVASLPLWQAS